MAGGAAAQTPDGHAALVARLAAMTAPTGFERPAIDTLLEIVPGLARDRAGNAVRRGARPPRLVACPVDEPAWVVGGIRPDGWLTVRRTPGPLAARRDQQLEGARVTVFGRRGPVPGVVAVRSIHLTRQRDDLPGGPFTADSALVDLGASSAQEVSRLGVHVLSPLALAKRTHRYGGDLLAAPHVGHRAACAALVLAAGTLDPARVALAFTVEHELGGRGLRAAARLGGPYAETLLLGAAEGAARHVTTAEEPQGTWPDELGRVTRLFLPMRYAGTPVETVALEDVELLAKAVAAWAGRAP